MSEPIHSRGIGRSGPKRKTGCMTCRRRKVRCDEGRPVCANCIRLRLDCNYVAQGSRSPRRSISAGVAARTPSEERTFSVTSGTSLEGSQQDLRDIWTEDEVSLVPSMVYSEPVQRWHADDDPSSSLITPFSEVLTPSLRSFDPGTVFQSGFDLPFAHDATWNTSDVVPSSVVSEASSQQRRSRHERLMRHFLQSINPTQLMQPSQQDWATVCSELMHMVRDCAFLRSAIYSLSALHLYCTAGHDSYHEAVRYYQSATTEVNSILDRGSVDDAEIRQAFAANFLLVSAELLVRSVPGVQHGAWPGQQAETFLERVQQYRSHIALWSDTSKSLLAWTRLLQIQAQWDVPDPALSRHSTSTLQRSSGIVNASWQAALSNRPARTANEEETTAKSVSQVAYDMLNQPGHDFFLKSRAIGARILQLYHTGSVSEILVRDSAAMQPAHRIHADLQALWIARPSTFAFLEDPQSLTAALRVEFANTILSQLQLYLANYYVQFIDLHRVAFAAFPGSVDVQTAVARILEIARGAIAAAERRSNLARESPSESSAGIDTSIVSRDRAASGPGYGLPVMMLWPLFLAATECSIADRTWIIQNMGMVDEQSCPSIAQIIYLLEEVLRRQDLQGTRVDHRAVRKEIFGDDLDGIY